jgi:protein ATS1
VPRPESRHLTSLLTASIISMLLSHSNSSSHIIDCPRCMQCRLFAFGSNSSGQLGVGHNEDTAVPQECLFGTDALQPDETIQSIAAGGNHTILLTSNGCVFASGSNMNGQCGFDDHDCCVQFRRIPIPGDAEIQKGRVTHIAATWEASFLVFDSQKIFSCGTGSKGELGLGENVMKSETPSLVLHIPEDEGKITKIQGSMGHVVVVTDKGRLFAWGNSRKGQIGAEVVESKAVWSPVSVQTEGPARDIALGRDFTFITNGDRHGRLLGMKKHLGDLESLAPIVDSKAVAGWSHLYFWNSQGLFGLGRNNQNQLPPSNMASPRLFAAGSEHCLAVSHDGRLLAWGWGEHGNCGDPKLNKESSNVRVKEIVLPPTRSGTVILIAAGCATSFVGTSSNFELP